MKTQILVTAVVAALALAAWMGISTLWRADGANDSLLVSGNIEAHESVVSFKAVQSRVVELPFEEGQWVKEGTLLARLDDADYRQQVAIDEAAIRVQEQQLGETLDRREFETLAKTSYDLVVSKLPKSKRPGAGPHRKSKKS